MDFFKHIRNCRYCKPPVPSEQAPCDIFFHLAIQDDTLLDHNRTQQIIDAVCLRDLAKVQSLHKQFEDAGQSIPLLQLALAARQRGHVLILHYLLHQQQWRKENLSYLRGYSDGKISWQLFDLLLGNADPVGATSALSSNIAYGIEYVQILLNKGAKVQPSHLRTAVRSGDAETFNLLLDRVDNRRKIEEIQYETSLADPETHPDLFKETDFKIRVINEAGLLQTAAYYQQINMIRHLLSEGADPNFIPFTDFVWDHRDQLNGSPLVKAVQNSEPKVAVVRALLEAGADPMVVDERGTNCKEWNTKWNRSDSRVEIEKLFDEREES